MSDIWTTEAEDPRTYGNPQGELATYREYLTNYRLTLGMKCEGLSPEQLATRSVPPSTLSLLGLVRHMAAVEHNWFKRVARATGEDRLYRTQDDRDHDFNGAVATQECVDDAYATWRGEIEEADRWIDSLSESDPADSDPADSDLSREIPLGDGVVSLRDLLVHMIEEYARHCGHADLLRERIDGRTGQ